MGHGLLAGTDTGRWWTWLLYGGCAVSVLVAAWIRGRCRRPSPRRTPADRPSAAHLRRQSDDRARHPTRAHGYGTARLLAGVTSGRPADLSRHREHHGEQRFHDHADLAGLADQVRLLGRGGAAFPVGTKLRATPYGAATQVLVNGSESEPASQKDRTLMRLAPHLVLDGALVVARALGTTRVTVVVHDQAAASALTGAVRERRDAAHVRVVVQAGGFVSGEVRSVIRSLGGGPAVPPGRRVLPHVHGVDGAPTYASNVETFAQLALLSSLGPDRFAAVGSPDEPGTMLLTLVGDVPHPGVVEVPTGLPLSALLPDQDVDPRPVLVGGYHGSWVTDVRDSDPDPARAPRGRAAAERRRRRPPVGRDLRARRGGRGQLVAGRSVRGPVRSVLLRPPDGRP